MTDVIAFPSRAKPRPVSVWPWGTDPEALRPRQRDLTALGLAFEHTAREVASETGAVAHLVQPEMYGLHADRLVEAINRTRKVLDRIEATVGGNGTGEAA